MTDVTEQLLTYPQAARLLGLKVNTLYSMVSRRRIPFYRLSGRVVRFRASDLRDWINDHMVVPEHDDRGAIRT